jgi:hypothetical protein
MYDKFSIVYNHMKHLEVFNLSIKSELDQTKAELDQTKASLSWRVTQPLRKIKQILKGRQ